MDLLEDLIMSLLNSNFVTIHITQESLALIRNHLNYLQGKIFECFLRSIINFYFFLKKVNFLITYNDQKMQSLKKKK